MDQFVLRLPLIGGLLALLTLLLALRAGKRQRLVDNLPTSKTTGVFIGLVELAGTAETDVPLSSRLAGSRCVVYSWRVEEQWRRVVSETRTDGNGRTHTQTRVESGWTTVDSGGEMIPFYLKDDCGCVMVRPEGAEIEALEVFDETCSSASPLYFHKGPAGSIADSTGRRRFREQAIPLHAPVYVMGKARERKDLVAPEIAHDDAVSLFLVSTRSERQISSGLKLAFRLWIVLGLVLGVGGFVWRDAVLGHDWRLQWPLYLQAACGFGAVLSLGWVWMVFNSLIDLRQRVRQGWAQVDVQLKRRLDLIGNLVATAAALRDHESALQNCVAILRAQQTATPPGVPGPDYAACSKGVAALVEAYPDITAQPVFLELQKSLADTEHRVALARGYFNEIASHYNARLEQIPDRFVAALGGMKAETLMAANDFERVPAVVDFAA